MQELAPGEWKLLVTVDTDFLKKIVRMCHGVDKRVAISSESLELMAAEILHARGFNIHDDLEGLPDEKFLYRFGV